MAGLRGLPSTSPSNSSSGESCYRIYRFSCIQDRVNNHRYSSNQPIQPLSLFPDLVPSLTMFNWAKQQYVPTGSSRLPEMLWAYSC